MEALVEHTHRDPFQCLQTDRDGRLAPPLDSTEVVERLQER